VGDSARRSGRLDQTAARTPQRPSTGGRPAHTVTLITGRPPPRHASAMAARHREYSIQRPAVTDVGFRDRARVAMSHVFPRGRPVAALSPPIAASAALFEIHAA